MSRSSQGSGRTDLPNGSSDRPQSPRTFRGLTLSPFQVTAVEAIEAGSDVLVSAPTGAGKTLVAEFAILDAVKRGKRCIYTAPIKALSNQKFHDFQANPEIDVGLMTGDVTIRPQAQVLVMTTEILRNAIFEDSGALDGVEFVVFDEVHFMDDPERGTVWEESLIFAPPQVRFISLSATIPNLEEVGQWLEEIRERPVAVIREERRPVPLEHRFYTERRGSFGVEDLDRIRRRDTSKKSERDSQRSGRGRGGRRGGGRSELDSRSPKPGPLFDELEESQLLPALIFSFSRKDCERLARANHRRALLSKEESARMEELQEELLVKYELDREFLSSEVLSLARRGVGYHHAGMLPLHKELVEQMFTSGLLRLLFTTETFALGINMPARTVAFSGLRKFDGVNFDYMRRRDFLQMAGRAGRQGIDTEGLVYLMLSERDLAQAPLDRILNAEPEPITSRFKLSWSSLLHLVSHLGRERLPEAWDKSFANFQTRERTPKTLRRERRRQGARVNARLNVLEDMGYLSGDEPTPRGLLARALNGFELQVTELLFRGVLECEEPTTLAVIFSALIYEDRRPGPPRRTPKSPYSSIISQVDSTLRKLRMRISDADIDDLPKRADWGLTPIVIEWMNGASFEEIQERFEAGPGDVCRSLRMTVQLMRQVRRAIDPDWDIYHVLGDAIEAMDRDEVDARRQMES
ncbi:MAG: DEAD/DEAH box helicase [Planctomycetota bacterium]|nr:DEAD/DEAH box helicase [Planctomycetota bacterium]